MQMNCEARERPFENSQIESRNPTIVFNSNFISTQTHTQNAIMSIHLFSLDFSTRCMVTTNFHLKLLMKINDLFAMSWIWTVETKYFRVLLLVFMWHVKLGYMYLAPLNPIDKSIVLVFHVEYYALCRPQHNIVHGTRDPEAYLCMSPVGESKCFHSTIIENVNDWNGEWTVAVEQLSISLTHVIFIRLTFEAH